MHPRQALWLVDPSLALRVHADGVEAVALDAFGAALLDHPAFAAWRRTSERGRGAGAIAALRAFLAVFAEGGGDAADDAILAGALGFEAHRLAAAVAAREGGAPLGVVFFSTPASGSTSR